MLSTKRFTPSAEVRNVSIRSIPHFRSISHGSSSISASSASFWCSFSIRIHLYHFLHNTHALSLLSLIQTHSFSLLIHLQINPSFDLSSILCFQIPLSPLPHACPTPLWALHSDWISPPPSTLCFHNSHPSCSTTLSIDTPLFSPTRHLFFRHSFLLPFFAPVDSLCFNPPFHRCYLDIYSECCLNRISFLTRHHTHPTPSFIHLNPNRGTPLLFSLDPLVFSFLQRVTLLSFRFWVIIYLNEKIGWCVCRCAGRNWSRLMHALLL